MNRISLTLVKYDFISTQNFDDALLSSLKRRLKDSQITFDDRFCDREYLIDNTFYTYNHIEVYKNGYLMRCSVNPMHKKGEDYFNGMLNSEVDYIKINLIPCEKSSDEIIEYIKSISSDDNTPGYFLSLIEKDDLNYELKKVKISEILEMDKDVKDYVDAGDDRHEELEDSLEGLFDPIVIHKGEVFDGYNRILKHVICEIDAIDVWISK